MTALRNGKIRESIAFDFQLGYESELRLSTSETKKAKINFKTLNITVVTSIITSLFIHTPCFRKKHPLILS